MDLDEVRRNDYNLNISRYVDTSLPEERIDVAEALARLRELERQRDEAALEGRAKWACGCVLHSAALRSAPATSVAARPPRSTARRSSRPLARQ